jgi:hypothetical protein
MLQVREPPWAAGSSSVTRGVIIAERLCSRAVK